MSNTPEWLEERLIAFGAATCREVRRFPRDIAGTHIAKQLVKSGTAPAASYAEARAAESKRDFVHKLQIGLKELRETRVWVRTSYGIVGKTRSAVQLERECNEVIRIFGASVNTALGKQSSKGRRDGDVREDIGPEPNG